MCDRNQVRNDRTGRCKACGAYTVSELKGMARRRGRSSSYNSKKMLCNELKRSTSRSRSRASARRPSSSRRVAPVSTRTGLPAQRRRRRSTSRRAAPRKRNSRSRNSRSRNSRSRNSRSRNSRSRNSRSRNSRSRNSRSRFSSSRNSRKPRTSWVGLNKSYGTPLSGKGSFQARHFSSKRKGPIWPAQNHCGETARGNDGNMWKSRPNVNGVCSWRRL